MKKEKKLTSDEAVVELFKIGLDYDKKSYDLLMKHYDERVKFLTKMIHFKENEEPLKYNKKAHKKWEEELEDLNNQLFETYKSIEEEFQYQQDFYKKLKEA